MHSVDLNGNVCVNLNDYNDLSDSIRYREKIDYLIQKLNCPKEITHFSISMLFRGRQRYYISNLYLWAIPYRTEGLYRGDVDHDPGFYNGKEFFIQRDLVHDEMQIPIIQTLESRYNLHTTFAMIRQCPECDFIIETYHQNKIMEPEKLYFEVKSSFERFIWQFLNAMQEEIRLALPKLKWLAILNNNDAIKKVITQHSQGKSSIVITNREIECLQLLAQGVSTIQIAEQLHISRETVNTHSKSIRNKLDCKNITEAVYKATIWGLIDSNIK